ncbi:hypothetical protein EV191_10140 [Tamaricihabitans halophyticus]|uniref:Uncharacterized protein n=1 Tax=Tamaricihabitans halophyticus TaxID=1262583 RepID=A0A4R2R0G0_9PSEU|nr:GGDEF domain-containing protein [Tamaricihabitans halophyticus]TCP56100.1 hypothetical protein EV191_10140 [Tamaricihabitans halophyticus]
MDTGATGAADGLGGAEHRASFGADELGECTETSGAQVAVRVLRHRWRVASLATGWRFPSDWSLPEVDEVCASVLAGEDAAIADSLAKLGRARATAGAGLPETLTDLAALHAVLADPGAESEPATIDPDGTPSVRLTTTALAWADAAMEPVRDAGVLDPLTGLVSLAYLRQRLDEVYRGADRAGHWVDNRYTLLVVSLDPGARSGWSRMASMVLVADVLRAVFDGGETRCALGPSTVGVLADREDGLAARAVLVRRLVNERACADPALHAERQPRTSLVRLPATYERAIELLGRLAR